MDELGRGRGTLYTKGAGWCDMGQRMLAWSASPVLGTKQLDVS